MLLFQSTVLSDVEIVQLCHVYTLYLLLRNFVLKASKKLDAIAPPLQFLEAMHSYHYCPTLYD